MKWIAKRLEGSDLANRTINAGLTRAYIRRSYSRPPVIIGGCPRSGTTLLLSILGSHPHILAIDYETNAFHPRFRPLRLLNGLLFTADNRRVRRGERVTRFCEKTPGNIRHRKEIRGFLGADVRLINMVRDGRDVVTSYDPEDRSRYLVSPGVWAWDIENALEAEQGSGAMILKYEELVGDPAASLRRVCAFLDEPFVEAMMAYQLTTNVTQALAWESKAQPIHRGSLRKWEREEHRERIREFLADDKAVEMLRRTGYLDHG